MMAILIRVNPEDLRTAAQKQTAMGEKLMATVRKMSDLYTQLNKAWDGGASSAALSNLRSLQNRTRMLSEKSDEAAQYLNYYASAFEALDAGEPISAKLSVLTRGGIAGAALQSQFAPLIHVLTQELRIVPDEVRLVGSQLSRLAMESRVHGDQTAQILDQLAGSWSGRAYSVFSEQMQTLIGSFQSVYEDLEELSKQLKEAAERYEELDNLLAQ